MALQTPLRFYSAWFCPYAQRAWIALNHCGVPYELLDGLVLDHQDPYKALGYTKHPGLLKANPKGLVPTLVEGNNLPVYESLICVEYASELSTNGRSLLPESAAERAHARIQADWVNKHVCSPFYNVLVRKDPDERKQAFEHLQQNLETLSTEIKSPLYFGNDLSIVDVALFPWIHRIVDAKILETFRGMVVRMPEKLQEWHKTMLALPSVATTIAEPERLVGSYQRYADATAKSAVAEAVRQGKNAHDID